jgi:thioesterase domain-containing protein
MVLRDAGRGRPFVFLHGDFNGGGFYCHRLAQRWRDDRPFVTIAPHGPDGQPIPPTIEAMAADRLRALREYQPSGPYILGGYCNGGLVAYEMARQLERAGEEVPVVVLLDTSARNVRFAWLRRMVHAGGVVLGLEHVEEVAWFTAIRAMLVDVREHPRAAPRIALAHLRGMMPKVPGADSLSGTPPASTDNPDAAYHRAGRRYRDVMDGYVPGRFGGRVVLLNSETMRQRFRRDPATEWRRIAGGVDVRRIRGEHQTCITEHLEDLVQHLSAALRDVTV